MRWLRTIVAAVAVLCGQAFAGEGRVQIVVVTSSSGADAAGALLSGTMQRVLNESGRFTTVAEKDGAAFVLTIETMGMDEINKLAFRGEAMISLYKVLLLLRLDDGSLYYLDSWAGYCGQERAFEIAANTAKAIAVDLAPLIKEMEKSQKAISDKK